MPKFTIPVELEAVCKWHATITIEADSKEDALNQLSDNDFQDADDLEMFIMDNTHIIIHDRESLTVVDYYSKTIDEDGIEEEEEEDA